ncbi:MAG: peptide chain release factor N(5)-glutamine methyltransferase [Ignavibacteria bacterium]
MSEKLTTLLEILNYSANLLKEKNISEPRLNAELLMADALKCKRLDLYLEFDKPLQKSETEMFKNHLRRRLNNEPVQYITGKTNFYGYDIMVDKSVLIPRPDTEVLVENLLKDIKESGLQEVYILEVGIGSGCIAIAVCKELEKLNVKYKYKGIDISETAIDLCRKNAELNSVIDLDIEKSDFMGLTEMNYDFVVSNPPYIPLNEYDELDTEVRDYEPKLALTDNTDGLTFYKKFISMFNDGSAKYYLEIAYNAKPALEKMLKEYNIEKFRFIKDYNNNYRILIMEK